MMTFIQSIIQEETGYDPSSRGFHNRNPGNIRFGDYAKEYGATGEDKDGFAIFPTIELGEDAIPRLLTSSLYKGGQMTVEECIYEYEGAKYPNPGNRDNNNADRYLENVCSNSGVKPTDVVAQVLGISGPVKHGV